MKRSTLQRITDDLVVERNKLDMKRKRVQDEADRVQKEIDAFDVAIHALAPEWTPWSTEEAAPVEDWRGDEIAAP